MTMVWLSSLIDNKGIGNGTSLVIFTNIVVTLLRKDFFQTLSWNTLIGLDFFFLLILVGLICISQTARITMDIVSARQLSFLENNENTEFTKQVETTFASKENGLSIRLNQAGIFPIIIASNIVPFFSYLTPIFQEKTQLITTIFYYVLIIGFNYFYTIVFWDPEKIAEQLRKASVSVVNITPGKETVSYLENVVRASSLLGGVYLSAILLCYDLIKQLTKGYLLNQINISSLIIVVGVSYETQKTIKSLFKNL
jgi:preprotein translocase subunit SecY